VIGIFEAALVTLISYAPRQRTGLYNRSAVIRYGVSEGSGLEVSSLFGVLCRLSALGAPMVT